MLKHIEDVLGLADEQLAEIEAMYGASLEEKEPSGRLRATIKGLVENQRSALEYLANAIYDRDGDGKGKNAYWPYTDDPNRYDATFDARLPGVRTNNPAVAAEIVRHQPFPGAGHDWMAHLMYLSNENKHRTLSPQTRTETLRRSAAGGAVTWDPQGVTFGSGVSIGGRPVDPLTQRTSDTVDIVYVDWLFADLGVSALGTLRVIQQNLRPVLHQVSSMAGL